MLNLFHSNTVDQTTTPVSLVGIRDRIAESLVGKTVTLRFGVNHVTKGVVRAVLHHADVPKLIVGFREFDLTQVLTSSPSFLNS